MPDVAWAGAVTDGFTEATAESWPGCGPMLPGSSAARPTMVGVCAGAFEGYRPMGRVCTTSRCRVQRQRFQDPDRHRRLDSERGSDRRIQEPWLSDVVTALDETVDAEVVTGKLVNSVVGKMSTVGGTPTNAGSSSLNSDTVKAAPGTAESIEIVAVTPSPAMTIDLLNVSAASLGSGKMLCPARDCKW